MKCCSSSVPYSYVAAMFGCDRRESILASSTNICTRSSSWRSSWRITFTAASRSTPDASRARPRYTVAIPPPAILTTTS